MVNHSYAMQTQLFLKPQKTMELYIKEKGLYSDKIDAIIALTPTVVEEILKISGPITYDGIEFNADNFTEKLEYEVEYGYKDKNLKFVCLKKMKICVYNAYFFLIQKFTIFL